MIIIPGATDVTTYFMMRLAADGTGASGLTATNFDLTFTRSGATAVKVDATLNANGIDGAHSDNTVIEVDATNSPGLYRVDWADAAFAVGVDEVICTVKVASAFTEQLRVELSGISETARGNIESQYDTTGISGDTFPATQAQIGNISTGSAAVSTTATSTEATTPSVVGTPTLTYAATAQENGSYHSWAPAGGELEFAYNFNIGANASPTTISWVGYCQSINDTVQVYARNWVGTSWEQIGPSITGTAGTTEQRLPFDLTTAHVDTGANAGNVRIRFVSTGGAIITAFATDRILCSYTITNQSIGYANGAIWVNTNVSNENTTDFVDGVADNPVSTWAAALTLNSSLGLNRFHISNGSTITLSGNSDNYTLMGDAWTLALGSQSIIAMHVQGAAVTGLSTGSAVEFHDCEIGTGTYPPGNYINSRTTSNTGGGFTGQVAGTFIFDHCSSGVAGNATPVFTFPGAGNTFVNYRSYSGGIQFEAMTAGDVASKEADGQFIEGTCSGGAVTLRGCQTVSGISNITLTDEARFDVSQITGGAYPFDTDVNGRVRIVDGEGTGEIATTGGAVDNVILVDTTTTNTDMIGPSTSGHRQQINQGIPHVEQVVAAGTLTVILRGPDLDVQPTAPTLIEEDSTGRYTCQFTPTETGQWMLLVYDAAGVLLVERYYDCVLATEAQQAMGLMPNFHDTVTVFPIDVYASPFTDPPLFGDLTWAGNKARIFFTSGKIVAPWTGYIYGVTINGDDGVPDLDSLRFFTANGTETTYVVRGVSENLVAITPEEGAWPAVSDWRTVLFDKPIPVRSGDFYGIEFWDAVAVGTPPIRTITSVRTASVDAVRNRVTSSGVAANLLVLGGGNNTAGKGFDDGTALAIKPIMAPPAIAVAGHSFYAGGNLTGTTYEDNGVDYDRDLDLAAMLEDQLGVSVVNVSDGGSTMDLWAGENYGPFESIVKEIHPSLILLDTTYNDAGSGLTESQIRTVIGKLDHFRAKCDKIGIELMMLEGPGAKFADTDGTRSATIEALNRAIAVWCQIHGVAYVPLTYRIGMHSGGAEHASLRRWQHDGSFGSDIGTYMDADTIHLTTEGLRAVARAIADQFRQRRGVEPRTLIPRATDATWIPPDPLVPTESIIADAVLDEVNTAATHNVPTSLGRQIRQLSSNILGPFTVASATANTISLDADGDLSEVDGSFDPSRFFVDSGTGADQTGTVMEYFGGAGNGNAARTLIMREDMKVTLDATSAIFIIVSDGRASTNQGQLRGGSTTTATLNALAPGSDVAGQLLHFTSGLGQDQVAIISSYVDPVATFQPIDMPVDATTGYELLPFGTTVVQGTDPDPVTYYVDTAADDDLDDGLDPSTPWETADPKVNGETFSVGDVVRFDRGDTWRETLIPPSSGMTIDKYGIGAQPIFNGARLTLTGGWTNTSGVVWEHANTKATKVLTQVWETQADGTLTKLLDTPASIPDVEATEGSFWQDTGANKVYVHATGSGNVATNISGLSWVYEISEREVCIQTTGANNLTIQNIDVRNSFYDDATSGFLGGVTLISTDGTVVSNCTGSQAIAHLFSHYKDASNCIIEDCTATKCVGRAFVAFGTAANPCVDNIIRRCHVTTIVGTGGVIIHGTGSTGHILEDCLIDSTVASGNHGQSIEVSDNGCSDITIRRNRIENRFENAIRVGTVADDTKIYSNVFDASNVANTGSGLLNLFAACTNTSIIGNTIYHVGFTGSRPALKVQTGCTNVVFKNNIVQASGSGMYIVVDSGGTVGFESDYNIFFGSAAAKPFSYEGTTYTFTEWKALGLGFDANSQEIDPLFIDPANGDFRLQQDSPAIGAGVDLGDTFATILSPDAKWPSSVGTVRQGLKGSWDIGAYAYVVEQAATAILEDTGEIGTAGDGLTNISLPNQTMDITGNLSGSVGSVTAGVTLAASEDVYHAEIDMVVDTSADEYTISWFKNGKPITSGITSPTLEVHKRADGTTLVTGAVPTQIGSTGAYKHDADGTSDNLQTTAGESALATVTATIDSATRTYRKIVARDVAS